MQPRTSPKKFEGSSYREFEFKLHNFEPFICSPGDDSTCGGNRNGSLGLARTANAGAFLLVGRVSSVMVSRRKSSGRKGGGRRREKATGGGEELVWLKSMSL